MTTSGTYSFLLRQRCSVAPEGLFCHSILMRGGNAYYYSTPCDKEPLIVVYQARNLRNGKKYIGMTTKGLHKRRSGHASLEKKHDTTYFGRTIRKYGIRSFEFSVLEECDSKEMALAREREIISEIKPQYNTAAGGQSGPQGWRHSEETKRRMSAGHAGKKRPWLQKPRLPETIAKMVATRALNPVRYWAGKKRPIETIEKIRATKLAGPRVVYVPTSRVLDIWLTNMHSANAKRKRRVRCITDGQEFISMQDAATHYEMGRSQMGRLCTGQIKEYKGLRFEFIE